MTRILTVGTDVAGCRRALELADAHDGGLRDPRHPPARRERRERRRRRRGARRSLPIRRPSGRGRWASTGSATTHRARSSSRCSQSMLDVAARDGQARSHPHTRGRRRHARGAARLRRSCRAALLLVTAPARTGARARLVRLVRRQRELPQGRRPAPRRAARCRPTASWRRPTRRTSHRSRCAASGTSPRTSCTRSPRSRRRGTRIPPSSSGRSTRNATECFGAVNVLPKRSLGQHFLVDENILGVIGRLAELERERRRARDRPRPRRAHALPRGTRRARACGRDRRVARAASARARMSFCTSVTRYGSTLQRSRRTRRSSSRISRTTSRRRLLVESLDGLPNIERWCVMVQREVADRLFAPPRTKAYGSVSVLVQLVCERTGSIPSRAPSSGRRRTSTPRSSPSGACRCPTTSPA